MRLWPIESSLTGIFAIVLLLLQTSGKNTMSLTIILLPIATILGLHAALQLLRMWDKDATLIARILVSVMTIVIFAGFGNYIWPEQPKSPTDKERTTEQPKTPIQPPVAGRNKKPPTGGKETAKEDKETQKFMEQTVERAVERAVEKEFRKRDIPLIKGMPKHVTQQTQTGKAAIIRTITHTLDGIVVDRSPELNQPKIPLNENISIAENALTSDKIDLPYALQASFQNKKTTDMSQIGISCDGAIGDFDFVVAGQPANMVTAQKGIEDNIAILTFNTPLKPESNMVVTLFSKTKIDITEMYYE